MSPLALPIVAVVPVKETGAAKQRLAGLLTSAVRRDLALAMLEDVLTALSSTSSLAGMVIVTIDPAARLLAARYGASVSVDGARDGHTGAVMATAHRLAARGMAMLTLPGDVPLVQPVDIEALIGAHRVGHGFTIAPARDERGSNAVLCSPATAVPLRFGEDSYFPHLAAARARGIEPVIVSLPRIALDIDNPDDLAAFLKAPGETKAHAMLRRHGVSLQSLVIGAEP
jgi:2-phospho-L-lactate guanylyltransferase